MADSKENITIVDEPKVSGVRRGGGQLNGIQVLAQIFVSLVVSFILVFTLAPSKSSFETLSAKNTADAVALAAKINADTNAVISGINTRYSSLETSVNSKLSGYDTAIASRFSTSDATIQTKLAASETATNQKISAIESKVGTFDTKVAGLSGLDAKVAASESKIATAVAGIDAKIADVVKTGVATTVDAKVIALNAKDTDFETRIKALETKIAGSGYNNPGAPGSGVSVGPGITLLSSPQNQVYASGSYPYALQITNTGSYLSRIFVQATATVSQSYGIAPNVQASSTAFNLQTNQVTGPLTFNMQYSPVPVSDVSIGCFLISGTSNGYIMLAPGATAYVPVIFTLNYASGMSMWNVAFALINSMM